MIRRAGSPIKPKFFQFLKENVDKELSIDELIKKFSAIAPSTVRVYILEFQSKFFDEYEVIYTGRKRIKVLKKK